MTARTPRWIAPSLAVVVAALALLVWLASRSKAPQPSARAERGVEVASAPASAPDELRAASPNLAAPTQDSPETTAAAPRAAVAERPDAELAEATWISGRVRIPAGTPADETIEVVADGIKFKSLGDHRVRVAKDGSFRVAFSKRTHTGRLRLDARCVYADVVRVDCDAPPSEVLIDAQLGGCLVGKLVPPPGVVEIPRGVRAARVTLSAFRGEEVLERSSALSDELTFELRGIPVEGEYTLRFAPEEWAPVARRGLLFEAGVVANIELECERGVVVRGRVVDDSGAPVAKADVTASSREVGRMRPPRHVSSGADGSFELAGVAPGEVMLSVTREGYLESELELGTLAQGEAREGLELRLSSGRFVAGRVQWSSGEPAAGALVYVQEQSSDSAWDFGGRTSATCDAEGNFRISGLTAPPFVVEAQAREERRPTSDAASQPIDRQATSEAVWRARVEDVAANQAGLLLILEPALRLSGRVVDDTGAPVTKCRIAALDANALHSSFAAPGASLSTRVDSPDGSFVLDGLKPGSWKLRATAKGHRATSEPVVDLPSADQPLTVVLPRTVTLRGFVRDGNGAPVTKARVVAVLDGTTEFVTPYTRDSGPFDRTDADGAFVIDDAPAGRLALTATHDSYAPSAPLVVTALPGTTLEGLALPMSSGGRVRVELQAPLGATSAGWRVLLTATKRGSSRSLSTDANGVASFENVMPGSYNVSAMLDDGRDGTTATRARAFDAELDVHEGETTLVVLGGPPQHPVRIHGRVRRGARGVAGALLVADALHASFETTSAADGSYEFHVEGSGDCTLRLTLGMHATHRVQHVEFPQGASEVEQDFVLSSGRIAGVVLGTDGSALGGVTVTLEVDPSRAALSSSSAWSSIESDSDGRFRFEDLDPGLYVLRAGGRRSLLADGSTGAAAVRSGLELGDGATLDDVVLQLGAPASVSGVVRDVAGSPVARAKIHALEATGASTGPSSSVTTDEAGRYSVRGLVPGTWRFSASTADLISAESNALALGVGASAQVDLTLLAGAFVEVRVLDRDRPVGAALSVIDARGNDFAFLERPVAADPSLTRIGPLLPGRYEVLAENHTATRARRTVDLAAGATQRVELRLGP